VAVFISRILINRGAKPQNKCELKFCTIFTPLPTKFSLKLIFNDFTHFQFFPVLLSRPVLAAPAPGSGSFVLLAAPAPKILAAPAPKKAARGRPRPKFLLQDSNNNV